MDFARRLHTQIIFVEQIVILTTMFNCDKLAVSASPYVRAPYSKYTCTIRRRVQMNDFQLPDEFPSPRQVGAVPGAQTKFLAVEYEGRYYSPGCTPPELYDRWQHCLQYVPQFVTSCIETKKGKRKDMPEEDILHQYLTRLIESGWVSADEARWVMRETAKVLGWPTPEAAHGD